MKRRFLALLLIVVMAMCMLSACGSTVNDSSTVGSSSDTESSNSSTEDDSQNLSTPITITIGTSTLGNGFPEDEANDFVRAAILEATGVDVKMVYIDEYYTALNIQLTGGTAPDFFYCNQVTMQTYADQGLLKDISKWGDKLTDVYAYIGDEYDNFNLYVGDMQYAFPKAQAVESKYKGIYIRQDILDKLNMEVPTTVDELYDFCAAAVQQNATGLDSTIGLGGKDFWPYDLIAATYGVQLGCYVFVEDGAVTLPVLNENMKDALTACKRFYDAGLVSPNTFDSGNGTIEMRKGQTVVGVTQWSSMFKQTYVNVFHEIVPDGEWTYMQPLKANVEGVTPAIGTLDYNENGGEKIVVNESTSDEKVDALVKVLNWLSSDEGKMISWIGIEGTHWDYDADGNAVVYEDQAEAVNYVHTYQLIGRNDPQYLAIKFPEATEVVAYGQDLPRFIKYNNMVTVPASYYYDDLESYIESQLLAFIKGERAISDYDNFVQELYNVYDLQTYLDICTEQLKDAGIVEG